MITRGHNEPSFGLEADGMPANVENGHLHVEIDTFKAMLYDEEHGEWYEDPGGGGGSGLPPVTSDDNGKVLGVEGGEWGPVDAPSEFFTVTVSEIQYNNTITADKTFSEITAAFNAGKPVLMVFMSGWYAANYVDAITMMYQTSYTEGYFPVTAFAGDISDTEYIGITNTSITRRTKNSLPTVGQIDNGKVLKVVDGAWTATPEGGETIVVTQYNDATWAATTPSSEYFGNVGVSVQKQSGYQIFSMSVILGSGYASYTVIDAIALYVDALDSNKLKQLLIHIDRNDATQNTFTETDYAT